MHAHYYYRTIWLGTCISQTRSSFVGTAPKGLYFPALEYDGVSCMLTSERFSGVEQCCWICTVPVDWISDHGDSSLPTPSVSHNSTAGSYASSLSIWRNRAPSHFTIGCPHQPLSSPVCLLLVSDGLWSLTSLCRLHSPHHLRANLVDAVQGSMVREVSWEQECLQYRCQNRGCLGSGGHFLWTCLFNAGVWADLGVGQQRVQWWPLAALPRAPTTDFFMQKYILSQWRVWALYCATRKAKIPGKCFVGFFP